MKVWARGWGVGGTVASVLFALFVRPKMYWL